MPTYNTGLINQRMRVTGAGLYAISGLQVPGAGFIDFSYYDSTPEYIEFNVPEDILLGKVNLYFITGATLSAPMYVSGVDFFPIPRLDAVIPSTQEVGEFVAISGKSLSGVQYVSFNNLTGTDISYQPDSGVLLVKIPSGYTTGPIIISGYNNTGIVRVSSSFNFFGSIFISGFSDNLPYEGDLLKISGKNFNTSYVDQSYFPVNFTTSVDNNITGFVTARFTGAGDVISGIVPPNANAGFVTINSKDNTSFTSKNQITVLKAPVVFNALNYYLNSGESNIAIGKNFGNVTGIILSGLNYREPKTILNSGVRSSQAGIFGRSLLFSGSSYLQIPSPSGGDFNFGTGPFTIEFLVNPLPYTSTPRIDMFQDQGWDGNGFYFYKDAGSTNWTFFASNTAKFNIATSLIPANQWTKVLISRTSANGDTFYAISGNNRQSFATVSAATPYTITAGSGLFIGTHNVGSYATYGVNPFSGYIEDFRIVKGVGLYNSINQVSTGSGMFDIPNTVLLLQGNYSDYDYRGDRNKLSKIQDISGYVEDYNYGIHNKSFPISAFVKNNSNTSLTFTGTNADAGCYDITLQNTGNRNFIFKNFEIIKGSPVIKNLSTFEHYVGGNIEVLGHNIYPDSQFLFQDTGDVNSVVDANENANSYSYQSTFRNQKSLEVSNSVLIKNDTSKFDDRSFLFSGSPGPYVKFSITGQSSNFPLGYKNSFAVELDFKPLVNFSASDKKYLIGSENGLNVFVTSDQIVISGIDWNGYKPVFSGQINTLDWNHLSISKNYLNQNAINGKILLNGAPINLSGSESSLNFATSNLDFNLNVGIGSTSPSISNSVFDIYIGRDFANTSAKYWSGYIDEIRVVREDPYQYSNFAPIRRAKNNINTEILVHANAGLFDDNVRSFGYLSVTTPNLSLIRKSNPVLNNLNSTTTGGFDKIFTFLKTPVITGIYPSLLEQGQPATGYGSDLYYVNSISIGGYGVNNYNIFKSGSEFDQAFTFTVPDLAQSGESLIINSDYYSYTYPSGLSIKTGTLIVDGFSPTTGAVNTLITFSGKFLNTVTSVELGSQGGGFKEIVAFRRKDISGLSFYIPQVYDITDGPIVLNGSSRVTTVDSFTFINPKISRIIPASAYFGDFISLSGTNLSGLDFYGVGFNNEIIKYPHVVPPVATGALLSVPRDVKQGSFRFFNSGTSAEIKGFSPLFYPSTTISGSDANTYRTQDGIIITGINAHLFQTRDLYISGFNNLTDKTGQYLISQGMQAIDISTLSGMSQPYTGYTVLSGNLNITSFPSVQIPDLELLLSGSDAIGIGNTTASVFNSILLDGYIGSGQIFFQRNSFDADNLYKTITIKAPSISTSTLNITTGTYRSLITLTGANLNYVTGIKFEGVTTLARGASGTITPNFPYLAANFKSGISVVTDARELSSSVIYKDYGELKFYPPSMAGKGMHGKDVEDIRPISGMFYLQTYLGEEYPVTGNFNYIPFISVNDAYLNNNLTYRLDGSTQVSGWDGSVISFNGEGVRYLTGVNFFTKVNGQIIEDFATTFQFNKKQAKINFYNQPGGIITGYNIVSGGAGYTFSPVSIGLNDGGAGVPTINAIVSFMPPYVGQVTGVNILVNPIGNSQDFWQGNNAIVQNPSSGFILRNPSQFLIFSGNNFATQSGDGSKYYGYYTVSTTFPLDNGFVVGEKLDLRLANYGAIYETTDQPFLNIQNPNNFARIADIILTGNAYVGESSFTVRYDEIYSTDDADFADIDLQFKTSVLYPTGYNGKRFLITTVKPSKNGRNLRVDFSTKVPPTGDYVNPIDPVDSKYLKLRIESINSEASLFKGLGSVGSANKVFAGSVGAGSSSPGIGVS
jgi:hypothetical protein